LWVIDDIYTLMRCSKPTQSLLYLLTPGFRFCRGQQFTILGPDKEVKKRHRGYPKIPPVIKTALLPFWTLSQEPPYEVPQKLTILEECRHVPPPLAQASYMPHSATQPPAPRDGPAPLWVIHGIDALMRNRQPGQALVHIFAPGHRFGFREQATILCPGQ